MTVSEDIKNVLSSAEKEDDSDRKVDAPEYAIVITEMEKVFAYFKTFIVDDCQD